jgi:hypothetical protein
MPARQTLHAHFGHDGDRSEFLRKPLGFGHGLEDGQTVRHPVASRIPVFVSDIVRPPKTIQRSHFLGGQFVGLGNTVPNDGIGRDQVQPGQLTVGEYIAALADQVPLHGASVDDRNKPTLRALGMQQTLPPLGQLGRPLARTDSVVENFHQIVQHVPVLDGREI